VIADGSLNDTDNSSDVTITFSEAVTGFSNSDVTVVGGTLGTLTSSDGITWTATFTADDGFDGTGSVTVNAGGYTDAAGNTGGSGSDTVVIDTKNPTATVNIVDTLLNDADPNSSVTITFSEAVTGFSNSDVTVSGGTLSALSSSDGGVTWNATFTATDGFDGTGSVTVSGSYTDVAGNAGATGANDAVIIDRQESTFTADNLRFLINTATENESTQGVGGQSLISGADLGTFQSLGLPGTWTFSLANTPGSVPFQITGNHLFTTAQLDNANYVLQVTAFDGSSSVTINVTVRVGTNGSNTIQSRSEPATTLLSVSAAVTPFPAETATTLCLAVAAGTL
jgi:hypothetical protein